MRKVELNSIYLSTWWDKLLHYLSFKHRPPYRRIYLRLPFVDTDDGYRRIDVEAYGITGWITPSGEVTVDVGSKYQKKRLLGYDIVIYTAYLNWPLSAGEVL